jgi:hypothetical protein
MANAEFAQRWFEEVWNNKSEAAVDEMLAEDGVGHGLPGARSAGRRLSRNISVLW